MTQQLLDSKIFKIYSKFKGYCLTAKSRYLLLVNKDLTAPEFNLYTLLCDVFIDWDRRHGEYGISEFNYDIVEKAIRLGSSKTRRLIKSLTGKGFVIKHDKDHYSIVGYELINNLTTKNFHYYEELIKIVQENKNKNAENNNK